MTWEPTSVIDEEWGRLQLIIHGHDVTFFRDVPTQILQWGSAEPFGDTALVVRFPQVTIFEYIGLYPLHWLRTGRNVQVRLIRPDGTVKPLWDGTVMSTENHQDETSTYIELHCKGAIVSLDNGLKQPSFDYRARDCGAVIAEAFNAVISNFHGTCQPVTTGILTRQRGGWTPSATGFVQDLLGTMTTADGSNQWTVAQYRRTPVIQLKDRTTVHATLTTGTPGLTVDVTQDLTGAPNVIYGEGIGPDGCFPADTLVSAEGILSGFTRPWSGDLVRLRTRNGHRLAATPNHPVLTSRGWVAAGLLQVGDQVLSRRVGQRVLVEEPEVHDSPAEIGQVLAALLESGSIERVAPGVIDFHGDLADSEVKVVRPHRDLPTHLEALGREVVVEPVLALADVSRDGLARAGRARVRGTRVADLQAVADQDSLDGVLGDAQVVRDRPSALARLVAAADGLLIKSRRPLGLLRSGDRLPVGDPVATSHRSDHALMAGAHDTGLSEPQADDLGRHAEAVRDALGRLPAGVSLDDVVHVELEPWSGHVYNLETVSGGYLAGGVIVHNSRWRNTKYPNFYPDGVPAFPLSTGSVFNPGSGTTGFQVFADELRQNGYSIVSGDTYSAADEDEIRDVQKRAGLTIDGIVGAQTWNGVFQTGDDVGNLNGVYCAPLASITQVEPWLTNARGARIGKNPDFNPAIPRIERYENFGEGITKQQAVISARAELARVALPGLQGTLTLRVDPEEISRFELRAGMNVLLKHCLGNDQMLHIAEVTVDWPSLTVTLSVDTHARDAMTLAGVWSRNADAATDPVRRSLPQRRRSREVMDSRVIWDRESGAGRVPKANLQGGFWSVFRIPGGQQGSVGEVKLTTSGPASKFVAAVFGLPVTPADMRRMVGANPLAVTDPWSDYSDALADAGYLAGWGDKDSAMGYYPKRQDVAGATITGRFEEASPWPYLSQRPPWLWLAVYSNDSCQIEGQLYEDPDP